MNEFAEALSATLQDRAQETAMSIDMHEAERQLHESIRSAERRRRIWIAVAATAAAVVVAAGITLGIRLPAAQPTQPAGPNPTTSSPAAPIPFTATGLHPSLTVQLPGWIASVSHGVDAGAYASAYDFEPANSGPGRDIHLLSVGWMYPIGSSQISKPSYAALVADWEAVQPSGYGRVSDVATTTVGGRPATTMTVTVTKPAAGLAFCDSATLDMNTCAGIEAGRTLHLAIVDQGTTRPPTLLWENSATNDADDPSAASEFASWLATVRFS
jgi:hypothetical protein